MGTGGGLVIIDFSAQGNSAHFRGDGWSSQEPDRVWGVGTRSVLHVPIQSSGRTVILEAEMGPCHAPPAVTGQIVNVRVNGTAIGGIRLDTRSMIRCEIDPALTRADGILKIEFGFPGFHVPEMLGALSDRRPLSCWFTFVRVYTTDMFRPGPHFPASHPGIPVFDIVPAFAETPGANSGEAAAVYAFARPPTASSDARGETDADANDLTVTAGSSRQLKLLAPRTRGWYLLRLDASPLSYIVSGMMPPVSIVLDGIVIAQMRIHEPSAWIVPLPRELTERRDILPLNFLLSDPGRQPERDPSRDVRPIGIAVTRVSIFPLAANLTPVEALRPEQYGSPRPIATSRRFLTDDMRTLPESIHAAFGMDLVTLLRGFETLGTNSEFGVLQARLGVDALNLFRFCDGTLPGLTRALTDDLKALDDPALVTVESDDDDPPNMVMVLPSYNLRWRTFTQEADKDHVSVCRANAVALSYMRRKFYEGVRAARKVYVLRVEQPISLSQAAVVLAELNRTGEATLLCVEEVRDGRLPGEVELFTLGLMRGYVRRPAAGTEIVSDGALDWLRVLGNAMLLKRGPGATGAVGHGADRTRR
jgi:hypothetical protein